MSFLRDSRKNSALLTFSKAITKSWMTMSATLNLRSEQVLRLAHSSGKGIVYFFVSLHQCTVQYRKITEIYHCMIDNIT